MPANRVRKLVVSPTTDSLDDLRLRTRLITEKVKSVLATLNRQRVNIREQRLRIKNQKAALATVWIGSDGTRTSPEQPKPAKPFLADSVYSSDICKMSRARLKP